MKLLDRVKSIFFTHHDGSVSDRPRSYASVSDAGEYVGEETAYGISAVWACVNLLAGTAASLPLYVYGRTAVGEREERRDHPLFKLLHQSPNYDQTAQDFWEFINASIELRGNAYARIERSGEKITSLLPIHPDAISVRRLSSGEIEYQWSEYGRRFVETETRVFHIRGFGGDPLGGLSTLHHARHAFGLAKATDRAAGSTFQNGLRPSGVLTFENFLTPEQRAIANKDLVEKFVGAANAGKPMILEGGTKWQGLNISPEDAQMLESRGFSVEEICRFFGVPPFMIGHTCKSTSWGSGLQEQTLAFQKFTLRRRLRRIEQAIEKQLLTVSDRSRGITVEFGLEGLLRGDAASRAAFYKDMTGIGAMTINEVRALENLPPVEGGNVPRMQMQNIPITEASIGHNGGPPMEGS